MPLPVIAAAALYGILRQIIMAVVSGAIVTGAQELLDGTFKELVYEIKDTEGITEQDAKDIVANILADLGLNSASIMVVLRTGAGVKVAEWLGLTSRNYGKKALTPAAEAAAQKIAVGGGAGMAKRLMSRLVKILGKGTGVFWLFAALTQIIEPLWYQPGQIQKVLNAVGFDIDVPGAGRSATPGPFSQDSSVTFADFATSIEAAGVKGINNPGAYQSQLYSRENLATLVNYVYGQEILAGRNPKVAQLLPLISPYLVGASFKASVPSPTASTPSTGSIPKVYTGIVSQGVIGKGLAFTPRPDDLIESVEELRQAAANNLAPFLETILGKIIYEVKIVSSIITKDGFKQTGTVQQIRSGTTSTGAPKYKTVVNKFATLNLYVMTDKGVRSKISTIVLGPTNSAKLTVGVNDIREVETSLPSLVTTTDINEIKGIETSNPVTISTPGASSGTSVPASETGSVVTPAAPVSTPAPVSDTRGNNALTLFDWFQSRGLPLMSVEFRAMHYEKLGLGQKAFYTGTAEQNSKLLAAFKRAVASAPAGGTFIFAEDDAPDGSRIETLNGAMYWFKVEPKKTTPAPVSSSGTSVPTVKGKRVDISSKKIQVRTNSKGQEYATIDGTLFDIATYAEFKKLRAKYV